MASEVSSLVTLYRFTVMTGSLIVGSMAAYRYGPPADQLANIIDGVATRVVELSGSIPSSALNEPTPTPPLLQPQPEETPLFAAEGPAPLVDRAAFVTPASAELPLAEAPVSIAPDAVVASLEAAGASRVIVTPWGTSGSAFRVHAEAPSSTQQGMTHQFDAIGETPAAAAAEVASQMEQARVVR
jgi:hypothetical protein